MADKSIKQKTLEEVQKTNELLATIAEKEEQIFQLENKEEKREKGRWTWLRRNIGFFVALTSIVLAIYTLAYTSYQTEVALGNFNFDVAAFEAQANRESVMDKINQFEAIGSLRLELKTNEEMIFKHLNKKEKYFIEEEGVFKGGDKIVQDSLSVDNLNEFLKNPPYVDDANLLANLWFIKYSSNYINNKIYDARFNFIFASLQMRRRWQKEIFEEYNNLLPIIDKARTDLLLQSERLLDEIELIEWEE